MVRGGSGAILDSRICWQGATAGLDLTPRSRACASPQGGRRLTSLRAPRDLGNEKWVSNVGRHSNQSRRLLRGACVVAAVAAAKLGFATPGYAETFTWSNTSTPDSN